ncbi:transcriptional regulator [Pseudacidovorax sp. NFM-22]|uniref:transcriptional regulator n=1 Tax=Pseudacidovorax sp. NFM-22 TaxID=2744469 RepID=UPI00351D1F25
MDLTQYFASERGAQARLAKAIGVPAPLLSAWASTDPDKRRRVPAERCPAIERATGGVVRCEDLRPDVAWDVLRMQAAHLGTVGREVVHG